MRKLLKFLWSLRPVTCRRMQREIDQAVLAEGEVCLEHERRALYNIRQRHKHELEDHAARCRALSEKWAAIDFTHNRAADIYRVCIDFDTRCINSIGEPTRKDMEFLGDLIGQRVRNEIATSRFVRTAAMNEQRDRRSGGRVERSAQ